MIARMNLKQLAKHLNLSQTTVSRALNGYPEVNAETRRRVDEVARKVGIVQIRTPCGARAGSRMGLFAATETGSAIPISKTS